MAVGWTKPWGAAVGKNVRDFYETLSEKDRRRFAAVQARQLGYGGVRAMAEVLGCSRRTIERGLAELKRSDRCVAPVPVEKKSPARLAP
jgi:hypothetical protein